MKQIFFTFTVLLVALWIEISLAISGFVIPLLMLEMFYLTVIYKWRYSFLIALIVCNIIDNLLGYYSLPAITFVIIVASFWRSIGDCSRVELQFLPISLTIFFAMLILMGNLFFVYDSVVPIWSWLGQLLGSVFFIGLATPFLIRLQDGLARKLKILTYQEIQREEMYSANR